ncbi:hypothetical protein ACPB9E_37280 [Streptomyces exfoliatus]|uniref:hypothetical protein n=1 Tax=Streptomyces exfoliatus TaxID=1905 RepID=UPI003C301269
MVVGGRDARAPARVRITTDPAGAAGAVWRRLGRDEWKTLHEALDNPDGDRLYVVQREQAR